MSRRLRAAFGEPTGTSLFHLEADHETVGVHDQLSSNGKGHDRVDVARLGSTDHGSGGVIECGHGTCRTDKECRWMTGRCIGEC